jgi:lipid-A-disaccharide synthase-like uncharacterized protein
LAYPFLWLYEHAWVTLGFAGQGVFMSRMAVQWLAAERRRDAVVPVSFWWLSLLGGLVTLAYAAHNRDPVFVAAQAFGVLVYSRNLMLISQNNRRVAVLSDEPSLCADG